MIVALRDFQIVGVLYPEDYEGAEAIWPCGFSHLGGLLPCDIVDIDFPSEAMAIAYQKHFAPV